MLVIILLQQNMYILREEERDGERHGYMDGWLYYWYISHVIYILYICVLVVVFTPFYSVHDINVPISLEKIVLLGVRGHPL